MSFKSSLKKVAIFVGILFTVVAIIAGTYNIAYSKAESKYTVVEDEIRANIVKNFMQLCKDHSVFSYEGKTFYCSEMGTVKTSIFE